MAIATASRGLRPRFLGALPARRGAETPPPVSPCPAGGASGRRTSIMPPASRLRGKSRATEVLAEALYESGFRKSKQHGRKRQLHLRRSVFSCATLKA